MKASALHRPALSPFSRAILSLALLTPLLCQAGVFHFVTDDDPRLTPARVLTLQQEGFTQVIVDGYIHRETVEAFRSKVTAGGTPFGIVYFNSAGGDLTAAEELGRLIRARGYATQIGKLTDDERMIGKGVCESACPIAFVGGKFRLIDADTGQLGIHRFYLARQGRWAEDSTVLFTAERDLRAYLDEMGISRDFFEVMMKTPPDSILPISKRSSYAWKLGTGSEVSSWNLTAGVLKGQGETSTGNMELEFRCTGHAVNAKVSFKLWFPATALLNYDTHSVTVNGARYPVQAARAGFDKKTGFIIFDTTIDGDALLALPTAERIGYALSFDNQPGQYSRALSVEAGEKAITQFLTGCR
ncbi:hypothetical protein F2S72_09515 [Pseudomonas syringae pv. actinidiae]|nr:hypothetical protein [Pseudomonas syringae pv. actinidiae]